MYRTRTVTVGKCLKFDYFGHSEEIDAEIALNVEGTAGSKVRRHFHHMDPDYDGPDVSVDVPETVTVTVGKTMKAYLKETYPEHEPPDAVTVTVTPELRKELETQGEAAFLDDVPYDRWEP